MKLLNDLWFLLTNYTDLFMQGALNTILVASLGTLFGLILAVVLYFLKSMEIHFKDNLVQRVGKRIAITFATLYVDIIRGTPMMVQAVIFYFGFAGPILHLSLFYSALIVVSFNTAAYLAEILRSGVNAIKGGVLEAATSLGMTRFQAMRYVILPQTFKNSLPALLNELIVNVKDSSVLNVIGFNELYFAARGASSEAYMQYQAYILIAIIYFIITFVLTKLISYIVERVSEEKYEIKSVTV